MKDGIEKRGENTSPMAEWIYGFFVRHFKALIVFGGVSLAVAVAVMAVSRRMPTPIPEPSPLYSRTADAVLKMNRFANERENELAIWSQAYAAVKDVPGEGETASNALDRLRTVQKAAIDLRRAAIQFYKLPLSYEREIENPNEVLYMDPTRAICILKNSAYQRNVAPEDVRPSKIKRRVLAGWVVLNALFALFLSIMDHRSKR